MSLLEPIVKLLLIGIGYVVGFLPVLLGSLGTIEPGPIDDVEKGGKFYRSQGMKFWHLTYIDGDRRILPAGAVVFIGWSLMAMVSAGIWFMVKSIG